MNPPSSPDIRPSAPADRPRLGHPLGALALLALLGLLAWQLHGSKLQGHWRVDDPALLLHALRYPSAWGDWFSASQWQTLGVPFFTPALLLDYRIDLALFGLAPAAFYAHHLLVFVAVAAASAALLQRHTGWLPAWAAAGVFLAGAPVEVVAEQLMARHYAMGLLLAIGSVALWRHALETGRLAWTVASALLYLLSLLNKEVFAPLPLLLPFLVRQPWRLRLIGLAPLALAAALYLAWRAAMLGQLIGGYQAGLGAVADIPRSMLMLLPVVFGPGWTLWVGVAALGIALACVGGRSTRWLGIGAALVALALPFAAIQVSLDAALFRYALVPWWALCVLVGLGAGRCVAWGRGGAGGRARTALGWTLALALLASLGVAAVGGTRWARPASQAFHGPYDLQSRFLWSHGDDIAYIPFGDAQYALQFQYATTALKARATGQPAPQPLPFADAGPVLGAPAAVWALDPGCNCLKPLPPAAAPRPPAPELPVGIELDRRGPHPLSWRFITPGGPTGCHLVFEELHFAATVPCQGTHRFDLPIWFQGRLRALVRTGDGRWNLTPSLEFPARGQRICLSSGGAC